MLADDSELDLPYESYIQDQIQTVTRYDIIADAVAKLPYSVRHRSGPALPYEVQVLQKKLDVKRIGTTYEVSIALTGPSPSGLAETVNQVTDAYVDRAKNQEFYGLDDRLKTLNLEKQRLQNEMDQRLAEQAQLMKDLGVATINSTLTGADPYDSALQRVRDELAAARMQREAAEAQLSAALQRDAAGESIVRYAAVDEAISADPGLSGIMNTLNSRRTALIQEMNGLRSDHPIYQKDKSELSSIDSQMKDLDRRAAEELKGRLLQEVTRTRLVELNLIHELGKNTYNAASAAPKFQRAAELGPQIDSLQKAYDAIDDRIRDLELESASPGSIHVSTPAQIPLGPETSKLPFLLLALLLTSLTCAIAVPVGLDRLDNRIHTSHDVERVVGFHPLAVLLDDYDFSSELVEEYLFRLAAAIDHAVRHFGARTFLFTSMSHGSGTSTLVTRLSEKMRKLNLRTRTIIESECGETDALRRNTLLPSELVLSGQNGGAGVQSSPFSAYRTRRAPDNQTESESPSLETVRTPEHHTDSWDVVLIDSVPLPISAYTEYLARSVDATVLVVKSSATTRQELDRAARLLERLEVAGVAVVLNMVSQERADRAMKRDIRKYEESVRLRRSAA
ncbi:MAG TPA: hypothetical protein VME23_08740 [Terracidiphilus sp.]|nr:hypothetical protein [Terracidiphilus sp.]